MDKNEVVRFSSFTLELNKASCAVWGFHRRKKCDHSPSEQIYEVAMCPRKRKMATQAYSHLLFYIQDQLTHRLRKKRISIPYIIRTGYCFRCYCLTFPYCKCNPYLTFTSEDYDQWMQRIAPKDNSFLCFGNLMYGQSSPKRFHLILCARHASILKRMNHIARAEKRLLKCEREARDGARVL